MLANQTVTVNQQLELGVVTQIVEVQSNALQVNTTNATLGQVVEAQRIEELPLNGRNVAQLALSCNSARIFSMSSTIQTLSPVGNSAGTVNSTDAINAFDKINGNSAFGTFRAGRAADPRVIRVALKLFF